MNEAAALVRLKAMTAATTEPTLSDGELETLLDMARLADSEGNAPADAEWTPTFDLNRAAAEGWRWKAAALATEFDFEADGAVFNRQQQIDNCLKMAAQYGRKIMGSIGVVSAMALEHPAEDDDDLTN